MPPPSARSDGYIPPCIPARAAKPPAGPGWVHESKHDGYRLQVRREGVTVRLFTRRGYDWSERYPAIARAAVRHRAASFTLDGEAVVCDADGIAVFDALHRRGTVREAILQACDPAQTGAVVKYFHQSGTRPRDRCSLDCGLRLPLTPSQVRAKPRLPAGAFFSEPGPWRKRHPRKTWRSRVRS
jgi:ATP dependent DNA ligase domain